ncbi:MAG: cytochrome c biogenesis protein CcdA [bacterium]
MDQFLFAFLGGLLSFISPCVLPLVPAYISYISGVSVEQLAGEENPSSLLPGVLASSLFFVAGFSLVFTLLGASATLIGHMITGHMGLMRKISGLALMVLGLHTMGIFRISFLNYEKRFHVRTKRISYLQAFVIGVVFAFGWTPCIGPILAGILAMAGTQESIKTGILLLLVYAMGLGIPFILAGVATGWSLSLINRFRKHFKAVEVVSGMLLITIGVMIFMNRLGYLSIWIMKLFPSLSRFG